jgi:hypothetical protein
MEQDKSADRRKDFLLAMYGQMWGNINRHILVIWQSVAALLGAFAVFALIEKRVLPVDIACTLLVIICGWVMAHVIDANYWFARNIHIISNIERQFLIRSDVQNILPYFAEPRKPSTLDHLGVQRALAVAVFFLIILWHFLTRVAPGFGLPLSDFDVFRAFPYIASLIAGALLVCFSRKQKRTYEDLQRDSPGAEVTA